MNHIPNSFRCDGLFSQFAIALRDYDACIVTNAGAPDEQETLNAVWRHFPEAFKDEPLPENRRLLKSFAIKQTLSKCPV